MITQQLLKSFLSYDPETGVFTWIAKRKGSPGLGREAGSVNRLGYRYISLYGQRREAHRLAWLYVHGRWPKMLIDHINGDPSDNRLRNLREANFVENLANSRKHSDKAHSPLKGVTYIPRGQKRWKAQISRGSGISKCLGYFGSEEEAHAAYCAAATQRYGEFANFGEHNAPSPCR